jgi:hypothetical protein
MLGVVHAKVPPTDAVPPLRVEEARVCPYVIALAVGQAETVGVTGLTTWMIHVVALLQDALPLYVAEIVCVPTVRVLVESVDVPPPPEVVPI